MNKKILDKINKLSLEKDEIERKINRLEEDIKKEEYMINVVYSNINNLPEIEWKRGHDIQKSEIDLQELKKKITQERILLSDINNEINNLKSVSIINSNNQLYKEHTSFNVEDIDDEELFQHIRIIDNGEMIYHFAERNAVLCSAEIDIPISEDRVIKKANPNWKFIPSWTVFKEYLSKGCSIKDEYDYIEYVSKIMYNNIFEGYKNKLRLMDVSVDLVERGSKLKAICNIGLYINKQCTKDFSQIRNKTNTILNAMKKEEKYNIEDFGHDIPLYVMKKIYER